MVQKISIPFSWKGLGSLKTKILQGKVSFEGKLESPKGFIFWAVGVGGSKSRKLSMGGVYGYSLEQHSVSSNLYM